MLGENNHISKIRKFQRNRLAETRTETTPNMKMLWLVVKTLIFNLYFYLARNLTERRLCTSS